MTAAAAAVGVLGLLIALVAAFGMVAPRAMLGWIEGIPGHWRVGLAVAIRSVSGAVLVAAAPDTRWPTAVAAVGVAALVAAIGLVAVGRRRFDALLAWWIARPDGIVRAWCGVALALGAFLIVAAM